MDYKKIYNQIIERAKNREIEGYTEKHHIIPKCIGGSDINVNIVKLTAREHFLCHMLLCEIYPKKHKLKHALFLMAIGKQKVKEKTYIIGSRVYERLRKEYSKMLTGTKQSDETKLKKSITMKKVWANKTPEEMSIIADKRTKTRMDNGGFKISEETKDKIRKATLGRKTPWKTKPVSQFTLDGKWVKDWESIAEITRQPEYGFVGGCISGVQKTAYGYIWKHKKE